jgi:hypothetical protein
VITRILLDGSVASFADDTPPEVIEQAIRDYLEEIATEARTRAEASSGVVVALRSEQPLQRGPVWSSGDVSRDSSPVPAPTPPVAHATGGEPERRFDDDVLKVIEHDTPVVPVLRMVTVEPYVSSEHELTPEEIRERLQRPSHVHVRERPDEFGDERFRDNLHATWSWYRPR